MLNQGPGILVVEDDRPVRNLIATTLEMQQYRYLTAENGKQAVMHAYSGKVDLILLDLGLPDMDGVEVIERIRSWSNMPIIVISARGEDKDKIKALDAGADDYLTKPFSVEELLARLRATIRRLRYLEERVNVEEPVFRNGQLEIHYDAATVYMNGEEVHLMPMEYNLLCLLAKNVGKVLTHTYILDHVWRNSMESDMASLRVYITSLRKKIESSCERGEYIQTHIGIGYRLVKLDIGLGEI